MTDEEIVLAAGKLQRYIESEDYSGYDPYDALKSPLFKLPGFSNNKYFRFAAQQVVKRSPVNLRPLLHVPKGKNPVTLGLCIQAYAGMMKRSEDRRALEEKCDILIHELEGMIPGGFHGACWGYDFDWEARHAKIPAFQPTVVATGIITNGLFSLYRQTGNPKALDLCRSACQFVLQDLLRTVDADGDFCFSYSPFDRQQVFNASMKGARLLAQVFHVDKEEKMRTAAAKAVQFVIKHQQDSGAWNYSLAASGAWVDNYHTGYVLDCLDEYMQCTGDYRYKKNLETGMSYYRRHFFEDEGIPKFYDNRTFPVDCTAAAQSLLTLCRFQEVILAKKVAGWMIKHMQDEKGYFYFRLYKNHTVKTSFMRWSNAWMFAGLSELISNNTDLK